jgi:peptidoglycan/xylan/chitin deacetylase (PgdA/CDA1 family)
LRDTAACRHLHKVRAAESMVARHEPGRHVLGNGVQAIDADRSGSAESPGLTPVASASIGTKGSDPLSANFEGFWKFPGGMLSVERGERMTAVSVMPGDGRPADRPPVGLPSLTPIGLGAPDLALVDGRSVVNFDLYEAMRRFYFEDFRGRTAAVSRAASLARRLYYVARPAIPRRYQLALRRRLARTQARSRFPAWPVDTTLDDLRSAVMSAAMAAAGRDRVPMLGLWPRRARYGVVLRHDVEEREGVRNIGALRRLEEAAGLRSVWNFVPERYPFDAAILTDLQQAGHEIGVHGLHHDGKLFSSRREFVRRAERINGYLSAWGARGFAAPSAIRKLDWIAERLDIDFDSSAPTAEVIGAQPGGCATVFPFLLPRSIVEIPMTAQQDHTLFELLGRPDIDVWLETIRVIRERGGVLVLTVHPDYMTSAARLDLYRAVLSRLTEDEQAWTALPGELSDWWRRRSESEIRGQGDRLVISGPARDDAAVGSLALCSDGLTFSPS